MKKIYFKNLSQLYIRISELEQEGHTVETGTQTCGCGSGFGAVIYDNENTVINRLVLCEPCFNESDITQNL